MTKKNKKIGIYICICRFFFVPLWAFLEMQGKALKTMTRAQFIESHKNMFWYTPEDKKRIYQIAC